MTDFLKKLSKLEEIVKSRLSEKRFKHTIGVRNAAIKLAENCAPQYVYTIQVAALLHDISKELSLDEQYKLLELNNIKLSKSDIESPGVIHSYTAPIVVSRDFSDFATSDVLSAVGNHTVGSPAMSVFDEIIFLADFIEDGRKYDSCIKLRQMVYSRMTSKIEENIRTLHWGVIESINYTVSNLILEKKCINEKIILTRNALLSKI